MILWLWRGHNRVNKRLSGEASEDPNFPKRQFPPQEICPQCWTGNEFNEKEVLNFLIKYYSQIRDDRVSIFNKIIYFLAETRISN